MNETLNALGPILAKIWAFVPSELLMGIFVGWGAVYLTERSSRKREEASEARQILMHRKDVLREQVADLVKAYQVNVRLLRMPASERPQFELHMAHAAFIAQIKLIGFEKALSDHAFAMKELSSAMSSLWPDDVSDDTRRANLSQIYSRFNNVLDEMVGVITSLTAQDVGP